MNTIQMKAYGKVNLGLDVLRRREDGYHEVRMIMQTVQLYDKITMEERHREGIELETNLPFLPVNENNIAYRAARMLMEEFHIPGGLNIKIEKHIPVAAGMAGGSTDGAAVLYGVNQIYQLGLTKRPVDGAGRASWSRCALLPYAGNGAFGRYWRDINSGGFHAGLSYSCGKTADQCVDEICL